ncbi:ATP-binding cassette domain-containing protein [archaeon]|nr:MAG: ATP-binding cassette domain-containing protein [archaeon]
MISTGGVGLKQGHVVIKKEDIDSGFKKQLHQQSLPSYVGRVPQEDVFDRELTVRELLMMNALARSRRLLSYEEASEIVDQVLSELSIQHISESITGGGENKAANISGGQLKRVNIACELVAVTRPALLLLDEPTAGLDATIAYELMVSLELIRDKGVTIFMVIQQPRAEIFSRVEHLFMMNQVGGIVFEGKSSQALTYLESVGYRIGSETSEADFCLDVLNSIIDCHLGEKFLPNSLHQHWTEVRDEYTQGLISTEEANVNRQHNSAMNKQQTVMEKQEEVSEIEGSAASRFLREFWMQAYRLFLVRIRNMNALIMYAFISFVMAIALSIGFTIYLTDSYSGVLSPPTQTVLQSYYPGPLSKYSTRNVQGVGFEQLMFFMSSALGSAACLAAVPVFAGKIEVLRRERSAGMSILAFISGALVSDCIFVIINAFVYTGIW